MMKVIDLTATKDYSSERDPDFGTAKATVFVLGAIPSRIYTLLKDQATVFSADNENPDGAKVQFRNNSFARAVIKYALKDVKNFPVPFKREQTRVGDKEYTVVADEFLDVLDIDTIRELHAEAEKLNEFSKDEEKNSEG